MGRSVEFTEGFLRAASPVRRLNNVNNESRTPLSVAGKLRRRGPAGPQPPVVCLPAPQRTSGAHEENASECNSGRGVARRSG